MRDILELLGRLFSYILWFLLLGAWVFTDKINELYINDLIMLVGVVLIGVCAKD